MWKYCAYWCVKDAVLLYVVHWWQRQKMSSVCRHHVSESARPSSGAWRSSCAFKAVKHELWTDQLLSSCRTFLIPRYIFRNGFICVYCCAKSWQSICHTFRFFAKFLWSLQALRASHFDAEWCVCEILCCSFLMHRVLFCLSLLTLNNFTVCSFYWFTGLLLYRLGHVEIVFNSQSHTNTCYSCYCLLCAQCYVFYMLTFFYWFSFVVKFC